MKRLLAVWLCGASLAGAASAVVIPVKCNLFFNGSNAVQIAWNCYPGRSYVIQTTTNLAQVWQNAPTRPSTLTTTNNSAQSELPRGMGLTGGGPIADNRGNGANADMKWN